MNLSLRQNIKNFRMRRFYSRFAGKGDLCFDIGAHTGERTQALASLGARVICVEPQYQLFKKLKERFRNNAGITVLHCALGSECGEADLMICDEHTECSTLSRDFMSAYADISGLHWTTTEKVAVRSLDSLIAEFGLPVLIKLDVEGLEPEVLSTLSQPVNHLHFEFNYPLLNHTKNCLNQVADLQYSGINFIRYEIMHTVLPGWVAPRDFIRCLDSHITPELLTGEILCRKD